MLEEHTQHTQHTHIKYIFIIYRKQTSIEIINERWKKMI